MAGVRPICQECCHEGQVIQYVAQMYIITLVHNDTIYCTCGCSYITEQGKFDIKFDEGPLEDVYTK